MTMLARVEQVLNIRRSEWRLAGGFFLLIAMITAVLEGANVVAVSSYLEELGIIYLPIVWIIGTSLLIASSTLYALVADRFPRITIIRWFCGSAGAIFLVLRLMLSYGIATEVCYTLLYVLVDQLLILFPLTFWAFANDQYNVAVSKRLFPIIGAGGLMGNVVGNWIAGISAEMFAREGIGNDELLVVCSLICFLCAGLLGIVFQTAQTIPQRTSDTNLTVVLRETWQVGIEFSRDVPLFRYLAVLTFCNWMVIRIVDYYFLSQALLEFNTPIQFQAFYGTFKAMLTVTSLLVQLFIAGRVLEAIGLKHAFLGLPITLAAGAIATIIRLDFVSAAMVRFTSRIAVETLDEPAVRSVQGLVPDARRGRVSTFIDSYIYGLGSIAGAVFVGVGVLARLNNILSADIVVKIYLGAAVATAIATIVAAIRLRAVYDESLLNWRLSRRKRRSAASELDL